MCVLCTTQSTVTMFTRENKEMMETKDLLALQDLPDQMDHLARLDSLVNQEIKGQLVS